jgi:hypothetical protein
MNNVLRLITLISLIYVASACEKIYPDFAGYKNARIKKIEAKSVRIMHEKGFANVPFEAISDEIKNELKINSSGLLEDKKIKKSDLEAMLKNLRTPDPNFEILKGKVFQVLGGVDVLVKLSGPEGHLIHVTTFTKKLFAGDTFVETVKFAGAYQYSSVIGSSQKVRSYVSLGPDAEIPPSPNCLMEEKKCEAILQKITSDVISVKDKEMIQPILDYARSQILLLRKTGSSDQKIRSAIIILESWN